MLSALFSPSILESHNVSVNNTVNISDLLSVYSINSLFYDRFLLDALTLFFLDFFVSILSTSKLLAIPFLNGVMIRKTERHY